MLFCKALSWKSHWIKASAKCINVNVIGTKQSVRLLEMCDVIGIFIDGFCVDQLERRYREGGNPSSLTKAVVSDFLTNRLRLTISPVFLFISIHHRPTTILNQKVPRPPSPPTCCPPSSPCTAYPPSPPPPTWAPRGHSPCRTSRASLGLPATPWPGPSASLRCCRPA